MRPALIAALLSAVLVAPALAAPPAFETKPRVASPAIPPADPAMKPHKNDPFDLRNAPQLDNFSARPDPLPDLFRPEEGNCLCLDRRLLVGHPCVAPRGEPKLYLLSPELRSLATAEPKK